MTLKRVQVVILPTEGRQLKLKCDCENDNIHHYACGMITQSNNLYLNGDLVHLYFLSDDEIEEDDWVLNTKTNEIYQVKSFNTGISIDKNGNGGLFTKKIIATTDSSLKTEISIGFIDKEYSLLQLPQYFIDIYVREYNKGNYIKYCDVEDTNRCCGRCDGVHDLCSADTECDKHGVEGCETCFGKVGNILKVNSKNEISIKKIKDVWTRDEVIAFAKKCIDRGIQLKTHLKVIHSKDHIDNWIEKNL